MGLFWKKPIYKCDILEQYSLNIEKFNEKVAQSGSLLDYCRPIGENAKYRIYLYRDNSISSFEYILRQEKLSPKKVVYLGRAQKFNCVLGNKMFLMEQTRPHINFVHPKLICVDIDTGARTAYDILTKETAYSLLGGMGYQYSQDCIESMSVQENMAVLGITRNDGVKSFVHHLHIRIENGEVTFTRVFPKSEEPKPKVPWRDKAGKISCPGDDCAAECDKTCPIWLNTMGLSMLKIKAFDKAIEAFSDSISLAPDFLDAQNNLGTAYGMNNQHQKAYEAFKKAHEMKKDYPKALHGLIVAETNLGMTQEALQHCNEYDELPGCDSSRLREALLQNPSVSQNSLKCMDVIAELLKYGRDNGYVISDGLPYIPELFARCENVILHLMDEIIKYGEENPRANTMRLSLAWSAFAGLGSTYHWHTDWNTLSNNGIFETLTQERGVFEMDEYVLDTIGVPHDTNIGEAFGKHILSAADYCIGFLATKQQAPTFETILEAAKAMFMYGMAIEMNRLGMK